MKLTPLFVAGLLRVNGVFAYWSVSSELDEKSPTEQKF